MVSYFFKLILLMCLILQAGCDITFKRKSAKKENHQEAMKQGAELGKLDLQSDHGKKGQDRVQDEIRAQFNQRDIKTITLYYNDEGNAQILSDMIKYTRVSDNIAEKLTVTERIPNDIQVMPLPLELEKILSELPGYALRVQVGKRVIIMESRSRRILDVINLGVIKN